MDGVRDGKIVEAPWIPQFLVQLVPSPESTELVDLINVVVAGVLFLPRCVLLENLEASFL